METETSTRLAFTFELKELDLVMRPFQKLIRIALAGGGGSDRRKYQAAS